MKCCESYIAFSLPDGSRRHEEVNDGTGVDLEIATSKPIWLEVKNWNAPTIPARHLGAAQDDYIRKMVIDSAFWDAMAAKFAGTHSCLTARNERPSSVVLGFLFEYRGDGRVPGAIQTSILQGRVAKVPAIANESVAVMSLDEIPASSNFTATLCDVSGMNCTDPIEHCSVDRRGHGKP